jgi:hypothetical protein
MSDTFSKVGNMIQNVTDALLPSPTAEKLIFRRFQGSKIADSIMNGTPLNDKDIETVALRINPQNVNFSTRKVIQKVQTSAPGRFVVFDWGSELTMLGIKGNTGLLLSEAMIEQSIPFSNTVTNLLVAAGAVGGDQVRQAAGTVEQYTGGAYATPIRQNALLNTSTYYETLQRSPKYITFMRLKKMYDDQDADSDIITLEFGDMATYRGFFEEFTFEISAESPWNWTYDINFIILADLTQKMTKWDKQHNRYNPNIEKGQ